MADTSVLCVNCKSIGETHFTEDQFEYCRDVNKGSCLLYEEAQ